MTMLPTAEHVTRDLVTLREQETVELPLDSLVIGNRFHLYPEVIKGDYFRIHLRGDRLALQARGYVGLIPINDALSLDVRPRFPISNLARLISLAHQTPISFPRQFRYYETSDPVPPSLLDVFAEGLLAGLRQIRAYGLHLEYQPERTDEVPRGRILVKSTVEQLWARGITHRVVAERFAQTADTPMNRSLKFAIWYLSQRYGSLKSPRAGSRRILNALNEAFLSLSSVLLDLEKTFLSDPLVADPRRLPVSRNYYLSPLGLSRAIAMNQGLTLDGHSENVLMSSFVISLDAVFEDYVREVLVGRNQPTLDEVRVVDGNKAPPTGGSKKLFDPVGNHVSTLATPDVVVLSADDPNNARLVIDVKYKDIRSVPDRDDLNQVIAYGLSYGVDCVLIVHPAQGRAKLTLLGEIKGLKVYTYAFDLGAENLAAEEADFSSSILGLSRPRR